MKRVVLRGSSGPALTAAFGKYLKYYLNCDVHWQDSGGYSFQNFPKRVEDLVIPPIEEMTVFLSKWRYYKNTCTESYSFAWKDWTSQEEEIDWMALNGFNMPLAFTGQEYVWRELYRGVGVTEEGLAAYFSGPAFLAWNRMSNLQAWGGPLSGDWIDKQFHLQKQMLDRYADLGMSPVLPAFNGVVPAQIATLYPNASISQLGAWDAFPTGYCCPYIVSSEDPLFARLGSSFISLQKRLYGNSVKDQHLYNCDTFNENKPISSDPTYLKSISSAVFLSMRAADPLATWIMQDWLFLDTNTPGGFWTPPAIAAFLSGVPDDGMIVLDLTSDAEPIWPEIVANKKPFIWCMLHNYGGMRNLYGNFTVLRTAPKLAFQAAQGLMLGTGLTMEAINTNPNVYEYMAEVSQHGNRDVPEEYDWSRRYAHRRYGLKPCDGDGDGAGARTNSQEAAGCTPEETKKSQHASRAMDAFVKNNYHGPSMSPITAWDYKMPIQRKPLFNWLMTTIGSTGELVNVWQEMEKIGQGHVDGYTYDLVDIARQVLGNLHYDLYSNWQGAFARGDVASFRCQSAAILQLIADMDMILAASDGYLLGTWIEQARAWGGADEELSDSYEFNARNQITLWGPHGANMQPGVYNRNQDYAGKNWAGLVGDYYLKRWQLFIQFADEAISEDRAIDLVAYGNMEMELGTAWTKQTAKSKAFSTKAVGCPIKISNELQAKYGNLYESANSYDANPGMDVSGHTLNYNGTSVRTSNVAQLKYLCDLDPSCVGFTTEGYFKSVVSPAVMVPTHGVTTYAKAKPQD